MKEASVQDDSFGEGYEIVELPHAPCPTGYFSNFLFSAIMSEGFNRRGDEYDVNFESVTPFFYDINPSPTTLARARLMSVQ